MWNTNGISLTEIFTEMGKYDTFVLLCYIFIIYSNWMMLYDQSTCYLWHARIGVVTSAFFCIFLALKVRLKDNVNWEGKEGNEQDYHISLHYYHVFYGGKMNVFRFIYYRTTYFQELVEFGWTVKSNKYFCIFLIVGFHLAFPVTFFIKNVIWRKFDSINVFILPISSFYQILVKKYVKLTKLWPLLSNGHFSECDIFINYFIECYSNFIC